jgi:hypothetical protein
VPSPRLVASWSRVVDAHKDPGPWTGVRRELNETEDAVRHRPLIGSAPRTSTAVRERDCVAVDHDVAHGLVVSGSHEKPNRVPASTIS